GELAHLLERVLGMGFGIVGAYGDEPNAIGGEVLCVLDDPVDDGLHIGAMVADEDNNQSARPRMLGYLVLIAVDAGQDCVDCLPSEFADWWRGGHDLLPMRPGQRRCRPPCG